MNKRQKEISLAFANYKTASRGVVVQLERTLCEYYGVDRYSTDNLTYLIEASKRFPQINKAIVRLMHIWAPVEWKQGKYVNIQFDTKMEKLEARKSGFNEVTKLCYLTLTSILNHPMIKVEIAFDWSKRSTSLEGTLVRLMEENGVTEADLDRVVKAAAKRAKVKSLPLIEVEEVAA